MFASALRGVDGQQGAQRVVRWGRAVVIVLLRKLKRIPCLYFQPYVLVLRGVFSFRSLLAWYVILDRAWDGTGCLGWDS